MKKRIYSIAFSVFLCFLFAACGAKEVTDGSYSVEATLNGGSGRASIESAQVSIDNGIATATIIWSSPFYEYMLINGIRYEPTQSTGNSTFEIPIVLDESISVSASTVAMSQPHLIDYTLYFDSATLKRIEP